MYYVEITNDIRVFGYIHYPAGIYQYRTRAEIPFMISSHSERIWEECERGVYWLKNREHGGQEPVDLKEFAWIKLQARKAGMRLYQNQ